MWSNIFFLGGSVLPKINIEYSSVARAIEYNAANVSDHRSLFLLALLPFGNTDDRTTLFIIIDSN